jgi:hypothetical protein
MGKKINLKDKIIQRSIGFNLRQIEFFNEHPDFKPDMYCRKVIDDQIALIDTKYLKEDN